MADLKNVLAVATRARKAWANAFETGDWGPYLDLVTDDYMFLLSTLDNTIQSWDVEETKESISQSSFNLKRLVAYRYKPNRVAVSSKNVVFEFVGHPAEVDSFGKHTCLALSFDVRGDKISACREYQSILREVKK